MCLGGEKQTNCYLSGITNWDVQVLYNELERKKTILVLANQESLIKEL